MGLDNEDCGQRKGIMKQLTNLCMSVIKFIGDVFVVVYAFVVWGTVIMIWDFVVWWGKGSTREKDWEEWFDGRS